MVIHQLFGDHRAQSQTLALRISIPEGLSEVASGSLGAHARASAPSTL